MRDVTQDSLTADKNKLGIQYFLITSQHPRFSKMYWRHKPFLEQPLGEIFQLVGQEAGNAKNAASYRPAMIWFKLIAEKLDLEFCLGPDDAQILEIMKEECEDRIRLDMEETGNRRFKINIRPVPEPESDVPPRSVSSLSTGFAGSEYDFQRII